MNELAASFPQLNTELLEEIMEVAPPKVFPKGTEILREGQFVKVIPIVLDGLVKVFTGNEEKELLLYYIQPAEGCIMSFASGLDREPSKIRAITEKDTTVILLPVNRVSIWMKKYPALNSLFYQQYNKRYSDLIDTLNHVIFDNIEKRLHDYLLQKYKLTKQNPLKISHGEIANDLATAREVISRSIKKLESENKVRQHGHSIELLKL